MTKKLKNIIEENKVDISRLSRDEKIKTLTDYAKECYSFGNKPTKRSIRKKFNVEIYNYFENIGDYYKKSDIPLNLQDYPGDEAKKIIIEFVKHKSKEGWYPTKTEIEKELGIQIYTYFKNIEDIYKKSNIDFRLYRIRENILNGRTNSDEENINNKKLIIQFIQENIKHGYYPSVPLIQKRLKIKFYKYFDNIFEAYKSAGVEYKRISPITLGKEKERVFTNIICHLLVEIGFKIERVSIYDIQNPNKNEDMLVSDDKANKYLVELKAFRKDYHITKREIGQLKEYMENQKISKGIFITTSNNINLKMKGIISINGKKLVSLLKKYHLDNFLPEIRWIQNEKINLFERIKEKELRRNQIIKFIQNFDGIPTKKEVEKNLCLDIRPYFKSNSFKELIKEIKNKTNNDKPHSCKDRQQKLQCSQPASL